MSNRIASCIDMDAFILQKKVLLCPLSCMHRYIFVYVHMYSLADLWPTSCFDMDAFMVEFCIVSYYLCICIYVCMYSLTGLSPVFFLLYKLVLFVNYLVNVFSNRFSSRFWEDWEDLSSFPHTRLRHPFAQCSKLQRSSGHCTIQESKRKKWNLTCKSCYVC